MTTMTKSVVEIMRAQPKEVRESYVRNLLANPVVSARVPEIAAAIGVACPVEGAC